MVIEPLLLASRHNKHSWLHCNANFIRTKNNTDPAISFFFIFIFIFFQNISFLKVFEISKFCFKFHKKIQEFKNVSIFLFIRNSKKILDPEIYSQIKKVIMFILFFCIFQKCFSYLEKCYGF